MYVQYNTCVIISKRVKLKEKITEYKICVSFISTTFAGNKILRFTTMKCQNLRHASQPVCISDQLTEFYVGKFLNNNKKKFSLLLVPFGTLKKSVLIKCKIETTI
jgi:hypothetical protein